MISDQAIRDRILQKVQERGPHKTICPSEVARDLGGDSWRDLMPQVRSVGIELAEAGAIAMTQKGQVVNPRQAKGPIRYRLSRDSQEKRIS
ncbi:DUF3253 domain-containing protein [filamentous cyanobacterium CCP5]|nr:DUF3253 domain-containing protein [filamentous cyanobacterium CCP5]